MKMKNIMTKDEVQSKALGCQFVEIVIIGYMKIQVKQEL